MQRYVDNLSFEEFLKLFVCGFALRLNRMRLPCVGRVRVLTMFSVSFFDIKCPCPCCVRAEDARVGLYCRSMSVGCQRIYLSYQ